MRRFYLVLPVILLSLCFTQCSEEELFTDSGLDSNIQLSSARTLNSKVPEITSVKVSGSKVTIEFTNYEAPKKPEGGFEIIADGKRTYTSLTPRSYSSDRKVTMTFSTSNPNRAYRIFARWNSGYVRSNEMKAGSNGSDSSPSSPEETKSESSREVKRPSNVREPAISSLAFNGSKVTLEFVNFASPSQPEGGFELMVDGKRTGTSIIPRIYSGDKNVKATFSISNPDDHCYQIYARWNSGYLSSDEFCQEGGKSTGSNTPPKEEKEEIEDDSDEAPATISGMKLIRGYEFENNTGKNVSLSRDGLQVHHLGHNDGRVVKVGGKGAYRFRITPGSYRKSDKSYRQEIVPKDLPTPYFRNGFRARWDREYVYEIRLMMTDDYDIGSEFLSVFGFKNDYNINREGSFWFQTEGDHYYLRQKFATRSGVGKNGASDRSVRYDSNGGKLRKGSDFHPTRRTGSGYPTIEKDKGRWVTWRIHVRWSYGSNGFLKVYKNGQLFHSYNGPNSYKDADAPYFKVGLYNSWWKNGQRTGSNVQEMYVDYIRVYAK